MRVGKIEINPVLFYAGLATVALVVLGFWLQATFGNRSADNQTSAESEAAFLQQEQSDAERLRQQDEQKEKDRQAGLNQSNAGDFQIISIDAFQDGDHAAIRSIISAVADGECHVTLRTASQPNAITKTFPIVLDATTANCNGDIPVSEFPVGGQWDIEMTATKGEFTTPAITTNIQVSK